MLSKMLMTYCMPFSVDKKWFIFPRNYPIIYVLTFNLLYITQITVINEVSHTFKIPLEQEMKTVTE